MDRTPIIVEPSRPPLPSSPVDPKIAVIVEGDSDFRHALTDYLLSQQFQVLSLCAAPHIDELRRLQPNVLVLDLLAQGEIGPVETLQAANQFDVRPAIVVTTADSRMADSCREQFYPWVSALLVKPFDLDDFDRALGLDPG